MRWPVSRAREAIGLAMGQEQLAGRWAGNGERPSGVLQSDKPLSKDVAARLKENWNKIQQGVHNAGNTAVLEDGIKWQAMQLTSVNTFQIYVLLGIADHDPLPGLPPVRGLQDRRGGIVLKRDKSKLIGQELNFPSPLAAREIDPGIQQHVFPGPCRRCA
jgi:hypothetical protein